MQVQQFQNWVAW